MSAPGPRKDARGQLCSQYSAHGLVCAQKKQDIYDYNAKQAGRGSAPKQGKPPYLSWRLEVRLSDPDIPDKVINKYSYRLYFSLLACLLLSLLYTPPFDLGMSDKEIFTYTGWAISKGLVPYRDFFDHKPPLIFFIYSPGLFFGRPLQLLM